MRQVGRKKQGRRPGQIVRAKRNRTSLIAGTGQRLQVRAIRIAPLAGRPARKR